MESWPGVTTPRWIMTPGHCSSLNSDPRSEFQVEFWPRIMCPRWIMTPGLNSTLNCDLGPWSHFNVEFWIGVTMQRELMTWDHNSTWNHDPGSQLNVEFWLVYIFSTRGFATQDDVEIQQSDQNSKPKEGHNSTQNPSNIDPGSVSRKQ